MFVMGIGPAAEFAIALPGINAKNFESIIDRLGPKERAIEELLIAPAMIALSALALFRLRVGAGLGRSLVAVAPLAMVVGFGINFGTWRLPVLLVIYLLLHFALHRAFLRVGEKRARRFA